MKYLAYYFGIVLLLTILKANIARSKSAKRRKAFLGLTPGDVAGYVFICLPAVLLYLWNKFFSYIPFYIVIPMCLVLVGVGFCIGPIRDDERI